MSQRAANTTTGLNLFQDRADSLRRTLTTDDTFMSRPGRTFRIVAINDASDDFHAVWTVELE
jgi:hypothetical protein